MATDRSRRFRFVLALSAAAGEGWGVTEDYLQSGFPEPAWTGTRIVNTEILAQVANQEHRMRAFLLSTHRSPG